MSTGDESRTGALIDEFISRLAVDHNMRISRHDPIIAEFLANEMMLGKFQRTVEHFIESMQQSAMVFAQERDAADIKKAQSVLNATFQGMREVAGAIKTDYTTAGMQLIQRMQTECDRAGGVRDSISYWVKLMFLALGLELLLIPILVFILLKS